MPLISTSPVRGMPCKLMIEQRGVFVVRMLHPLKRESDKTEKEGAKREEKKEQTKKERNFYGVNYIF